MSRASAGKNNAYRVTVDGKPVYTDDVTAAAEIFHILGEKPAELAILHESGKYYTMMTTASSKAQCGYDPDPRT